MLLIIYCNFTVTFKFILRKFFSKYNVPTDYHSSALLQYTNLEVYHCTLCNFPWNIFNNFTDARMSLTAHICSNWMQWERTVYLHMRRKKMTRKLWNLSLKVKFEKHFVTFCHLEEHKYSRAFYFSLYLKTLRKWILQFC